MCEIRTNKKVAEMVHGQMRQITATAARMRLGKLPFPRSGVLEVTWYGKRIGVFFLTPEKFKKISGEKDIETTTRGTVITKYGRPIMVIVSDIGVFAMELQAVLNRKARKA